jgi:CSLREA domain-containing protein
MLVRWLSAQRRAFAGLCLLFIATGSAPLRAQPVNDNFASRETITLPYADTEGAIALATTEATDPPFFCRLGSITLLPTPSVAPAVKTVWYRYVTGAQTEYVNLQANGYDSILAVYAGSSTTTLEPVVGGCNDGGGSANAARINGLRLAPKTEYAIVVAAFNSSVAANTLSFSAESARIYQVNKTADSNDGSCDADCSLREAVAASNTTPGAVLIPAGNYALTLTGSGENNNATGDIDVRQGMGLYGAGSALTAMDGNNTDRVLHIDPADAAAYTVSLADLAVVNGNTAADGGGIASSGTNILTADFAHLGRVRIANNRSTANRGGGGAFNADVWLDECTIENNQATSVGGGLSFSGSTATEVRARVQRSTVSNNLSTDNITGGGGVFSSTLSTLIDGSTISGNRANLGGGGVLINNANFAIADTTVTGNSADNDGNGSGLGGGLRYQGSILLLGVSNTILSANTQGAAPGTPSDCSVSGAPTVQTSYTLVTAPGNCTFTGTGDTTAANVGLGPLADNGGATFTHAPAEGSPAIDSGPATCLPEDQRGVKRPQDGDGNGSQICDRGSVEVTTEVIFRNGFED